MKQVVAILVILVTRGVFGQNVIYYSALRSRDLYQYNLEDKSSRFIASLTFEPFDIAVDSGNILYGTDGSTLYTLNLNTLEYGRAYSLTDGVNSLVYVNKSVLLGLDFDGALYSINPVTGSQYRIAESHHPPRGDLVLSSKGDIYWTATDNHLYQSQPYPGSAIKDLGNLENMMDVKGLAIVRSSVCADSEEKLLCFDRGDIYMVGLDNKSTELVSSYLFRDIGGAASYSLPPKPLPAFIEPDLINVITANGDDRNTTFKLNVNNPEYDFKISIHNRFGQTVFFSREQDFSWNPVIENCIGGVYFYTISYSTECFPSIQFRGWIEVVR